MQKLVFYILLITSFSGCLLGKKYDHLPQTQFLWREIEMDEKFNHDLSILKLNQGCIDTLTEREKAAITYLSTWVGNDCDWEDDNNQLDNNLKCKIISAFDLGYQCSDKHIGLLTKWFKNDEQAMKLIGRCTNMERTNKSLTGFYFMDLARTGNLFIVTYDIFGVGIKNYFSFEWSAEVVFEMLEDEIKIVRFYETPITKVKIDLLLYYQIHLAHPDEEEGEE
ncbi:MAG: hypothetical protein HRT72_12930 [Flavobacteriales bacterium]|nr:hypothetical protein [Flavobacteriales bacterium]